VLPATINPGLELIVGLGNPGSKYDKTRHNAGFWFLDSLAHRFNTTFRAENKFQGDVATVRHADRLIYLLKPTTYMNNSGQSVAALARFYKIPVEHILVTHDELDLPAGSIKLKRGGGHGGHNGLRDMVALGSSDYWRMRIGISHPGDKNQVIDYVLKQPSQDDRRLIDTAIDKGLDIVDLMLEGQMEKAMHRLHTV
jgi:PTH1 family peptidyl-tRNA hydrolase